MQIPIHLRNKIIRIEENCINIILHFYYDERELKNTKQFFRFQLNLMELDSWENYNFSMLAMGDGRP